MKAEPLLLLSGLGSGKRLQALFSLQSNSSKIKFVPEYSACGKCMASFLDSAGEEICLPAWICEHAYSERLNAKVYDCNTFWHIILTLVVADGCFVCLKLQPMVISLSCPETNWVTRLSSSWFPSCRADCVLRFAGSTEEDFQLLGTGPQIFLGTPVYSSRICFVAAYVDKTSRAGLVENGHPGDVFYVMALNLTNAALHFMTHFKPW